MDSLNFDEKTKVLISNIKKEIELKEKEINTLKNELAFFKNQIINKNKKIFGKSSEQAESNQLSLFDEAEKYSDIKADEPTIEEITYKRKKPSSYVGKKDNLANLERVVIEHKLDSEKAICDKCNEPLVVIGTKSKEILKYKPPELYIEEHITYSYACKDCEEKQGTANIVTTKAHNNLLYKIEKELKEQYKGASSSATIYSIIETAKANDLSVEKYLVYLMDVLANIEYKDKNKDTLLKYMPWSQELTEEVHLKNKNINNLKN